MGGIYLFLCVTAAGCNLSAVLTDATVFFASKRMLSGRMSQSADDAIDAFEQYWRDPRVELARRMTRDMFFGESADRVICSLVHQDSIYQLNPL